MFVCFVKIEPKRKFFIGWKGRLEEWRVGERVLKLLTICIVVANITDENNGHKKDHIRIISTVERKLDYL